MDNGNSITTYLLTLLNVSATKIGKRKRVEQDFIPSEKLNKRKSTEPYENSEEKENDMSKEDGVVPAENGADVNTGDVDMGDEAEDTTSHGEFRSQFLRTS